MNRSELQHSQSAAQGPAGGASITTNGIDGGQLPRPIQNILAYVDAPALNGTQLPNGETLTFSLLESNDRTFATFTSQTTMGVQTGAGGNGAPAACFAARPKLAGGTYLAMRVTASAGANASGDTLILGFALGTDKGIHG